MNPPLAVTFAVVLMVVVGLALIEGAVASRWLRARLLREQGKSNPTEARAGAVAGAR